MENEGAYHRFLPPVLQKVTFGEVKGGLRFYDRRPFSVQKNTFWRPKRGKQNNFGKVLDNREMSKNSQNEVLADYISVRSDLALLIAR